MARSCRLFLFITFAAVALTPLQSAHSACEPTTEPVVGCVIGPPEAPEPPPAPEPEPSPAPEEPPEQPTPEEPAPAALTPAAAAHELLRLANRDRTAAGLRPLIARSDAAEIAAEHSAAMANRGDIWHNDSYFTATTRRLLKASRLGENVAMNGDVADTHRRLMDSPGHRANLLDRGFTAVGIGVRLDSAGIYYVTQNFLESATGSAGAATPGASNAQAATAAVLLASPEVTPEVPSDIAQITSRVGDDAVTARRSAKPSVPSRGAGGDVAAPAVAAAALLLVFAVLAVACNGDIRAAAVRVLAMPAHARATAAAGITVAVAVALLTTSTPADATATAPSKIVGFIVGGNEERVQALGYDNERIVANGGNTVAVTTWWAAEELSSRVARLPSTRTDLEVQGAIRNARAAGLTPVLYPLLACTECPQGWRGMLQPANRSIFFASYRSMIQHYARLAEAERVPLLIIGSEMTSLQDETEEWRKVAAAARTHFSGEIAYSANWDAIGGVGFWDAVDVPSVSAYFPLTQAPRPTIEELKAAWRSGRQRLTWQHDIFSEVRSLAERTGKRVLFAEAGYRSVDGAATLPFDSKPAAPNTQLQADAYQALLETFDHEPWWRGALWWEWTMPTGSPATDASFTPRDKPAEAVLRAWYREGKRPQVAGDRVTAEPAAVLPRV